MDNEQLSHLYSIHVIESLNECINNYENKNKQFLISITHLGYRST